ncbi:MAG: methylglyoxal synthase [Parafilimonas sp.]|nr:methylglyoxal synthase [Parafilimonas sp.]
MKKIKNIAIIALDSKKTDLIEWSYFNKEFLIPHSIFAFGFAANILEGTLNKIITELEPANMGGHRQLCNLIENGKVDALVIFGESNELFESKDLKAILEAAVEYNIIVAVNRTTADFVLHSSLLQNDYKIHAQEKKQTDKKSELNSSATYPLAKAS